MLGVDSPPGGARAPTSIRCSPKRWSATLVSTYRPWTEVMQNQRSAGTGARARNQEPMRGIGKKQSNRKDNPRNTLCKLLKNWELWEGSTQEEPEALFDLLFARISLILWLPK